MSERLARQYAAEGLLPPTRLKGRSLPYDEEHLLHLRLVMRLVAQYVPLRDIQRFIGELSADGVRMLVDRPLPARSPSEGDANAYLAKLARADTYHSTKRGSALGDGIGPLRPVPTPPQPRGGSVVPLQGVSALDSGARHGLPKRAQKLAQTSSVTPSVAVRTQWLRVEIEPGIELHVQTNEDDDRSTLIEALAVALHDTLASERGIKI